MKKISIIMLAVLLVMSIGQSAFAKANIGLSAGYTYAAYNGVNLVLSGDYKFNNWFSLDATIAGSVLFEDGYKSSRVGAEISANFDLYETNNFILGAQANLMYQSVFYTENVVHNFGIGPGLYVKWNISPKFDLYGDLYVPVLVAAPGTVAFNYVPVVTLGVDYAISSNIKLGFEAGLKFIGIVANLKATYSF